MKLFKEKNVKTEWLYGSLDKKWYGTVRYVYIKINSLSYTPDRYLK